VAHRPQDHTDIEAILAAHPKIKVRRVRRWFLPYLRENTNTVIARRIPFLPSNEFRSFRLP